jgi:hypothetical protein
MQQALIGILSSEKGNSASIVSRCRILLNKTCHCVDSAYAKKYSSRSEQLEFPQGTFHQKFTVTPWSFSVSLVGMGGGGTRYNLKLQFRK